MNSISAYLLELRVAVAEKDRVRLLKAAPMMDDSSKKMVIANWLAIAGFVAFIFGCLCGAFALVRF